jgi:hypothetical protein
MNTLQGQNTVRADSGATTKHGVLTLPCSRFYRTCQLLGELLCSKRLHGIIAHLRLTYRVHLLWLLRRKTYCFSLPCRFADPTHTLLRFACTYVS